MIGEEGREEGNDGRGRGRGRERWGREREGEEMMGEEGEIMEEEGGGDPSFFSPISTNSSFSPIHFHPLPHSFSSFLLSLTSFPITLHHPLLTHSTVLVMQ